MVLSLAIFLAEQEKKDEVEESHMLMALLQEGEGVPVRKLVDMGFDLNLWLQRLISEQQDIFEGNFDEDSISEDFDFSAISDTTNLEQLFEDEIRPALASHGGSVEIVDLDNNILSLKLSGGCQGCAGARATCSTSSSSGCRASRRRAGCSSRWRS